MFIRISEISFLCLHRGFPDFFGGDMYRGQNFGFSLKGDGWSLLANIEFSPNSEKNALS